MVTQISATIAGYLRRYTPPVVGGLRRPQLYRLDQFSVEKPMTFLNALGRDVEIAIRPRREEIGHISVLATS